MAHPSFERIDHRPWPLPDRPWSWRQSWLDLLFAHWPVPAAHLQRYVPAPLLVQEFEGTSWVGLVPFRMAGVMRRPLPDLPWISAFPELNVRLYVEHQGKPGVWFLSLDATNPLAVWAARRFFHLPYFRARIELQAEGDAVHYTSRRGDEGPRLEARYRPTSAPYEAKPGTLERWLTERYCLYAQAPDGTIVRNDVHHVPWPLQAADAEIAENSYLASHGLPVAGPPALLHFARGIDVVVWGGRPVAWSGDRPGGKLDPSGETKQRAIRTVTLRNFRDADGSRHLTATLDPGGNVVIEGRDAGDGVERILGDRELEWVWTVPAASVPALRAALGEEGEKGDVLAALAARFSGHDAGGLGGFLEAAGIPTERWSRQGD